MTKPSVSIRELLDESLVEQLTGELEESPKRGVLLHRIALAAACLALVAGIAGAGLWAAVSPPPSWAPAAPSAGKRAGLPATNGSGCWPPCCRPYRTRYPRLAIPCWWRSGRC